MCYLGYLVIEERLEFGLELLHVLRALGLGYFEAAGSRVHGQRGSYEHDAAPVGHRVLLVVLERVVEVDGVD